MSGLQGRLRQACDRVEDLGAEARRREAAALQAAADYAHARETAAAAHRLAAARLDRGLRGTGQGLSRLREVTPGPAVLVTYSPPESPVGRMVRPGSGGPWRAVLRRAL